MHTRYRHILILLGLAVLLMLPGISSAQDRSVVWDRWDVRISQVDTTNNSFMVREDYVLSFDGTFRFGSRVIPDENLESIRNVAVYQDGQPLQPGCNESPGTFCTRNVQEGLSITYYFNQPIANASGNFSIEYRVNGALRYYEGGDQLWWIAVPEEKFGFPVRASRITVQMPEGYAPREGVDPVRTYGAQSNVSVDGRTVMATAANGVDPNQTFEIRVQYPHNPNGQVAAWQSSFDQQRAFEENVKPLLDLVFIVLGILIAIGGPLAMYAFWYSRGRDPKVGPVPEYLSEPPSNLPPAVVGTLLDEKADTRDVISTLIDLGKRGYLVIQEDKTSGFLGFSQQSEFTFKRTDKPLDDLRSFERTVIERIFRGKLERKMSDLKNSFYQYMDELKDDLYGELVERGLFTKKPSNTRNVYMVYSIIFLVLTGIVAVLAFNAIESFTPTLLALPGGMAITGIAIMVLGEHMPRKTRKGAEEAAKWDAFREYMRNLDRYDDKQNAAEAFDDYLPYAVAFDQSRTWITRFSRVENTPVPMWYYPTYHPGYYGGGYRAGTPLSDSLPSANDVMPGDLASAESGGLEGMADSISGGLEDMASGISEMLDSAANTLTSQPSSSGSGSWAGGGGSFSGGGSIGGGGSGGGSAGFG